MRRVEPKVFLVGETGFNMEGLENYFNHLGSEGVKWFDENIPASPGDLPSQSELMVEVMGRLCYRSWAPGMNANVTKIREGNDKYLANILFVKHGSVLEHAVTNWVFADVSRVFTHELVRHRAGTAYSQESLRFVRLTDLGLWLPPEAKNDPELVEMFEGIFVAMEELQRMLAKKLGLDDEGRQFKEKKVLTSMMRRVAPEGLATSIGASFNFRALRHIIEMRTAEGAEAEIRLVFDKVAEICKSRWKNLFSDFTRNEKGEWKPEHSKV